MAEGEREGKAVWGSEEGWGLTGARRGEAARCGEAVKGQVAAAAPTLGLCWSCISCLPHQSFEQSEMEYHPDSDFKLWSSSDVT